MSGAPTSACASATRLVRPPDSEPMRAPGSRPNWAIVVSTRVRSCHASAASNWDCSACSLCSASSSWESPIDVISASYSASRPAACGTPIATASATVCSGSNSGSCGTYAEVTPLWRAISPSSGEVVPATILSSDDLPVPLRPIRPTRSPASSEKSVWSSSATWPNASCASVMENRAMLERKRVLAAYGRKARIVVAPRVAHRRHCACRCRCYNACAAGLAFSGRAIHTVTKGE